jgi:hypothetical protein
MIIIKEYNYTLYNKLGLLHREDGPAIEYDNGSFEYYQHNKIHRIKGPAEFYLSFPMKFWRRKGKIHRLNAPAIMKNDNFVTKKFYEFGNFLK